MFDMLTKEFLLGAFAAYNQKIWPMQPVAILLGVVAFLLLLRSSRNATRLINAILACFWLWIGLVFWWPSRAAFPPASFLSVLFVLQGLLLVAEVLRPRLSYRFSSDALPMIGVFSILYGLLGSPLVGMLFGHLYPRMALSTLFPCPLVVFTFGLFLTSRQKIPKYLLVIPFVWSISSLIAISVGNWEDAYLFLIGIVGTWLIWRRDKELVFERPQKAANLAG